MEIEVMGHKGQIYEVKAEQGGLRWPGEDDLIVFLSFNEPDEPAFGFTVNLPARRWSREDFLLLVKDGAEDKLAEILAHSKEEIKDHQRQWYERQKELAALVDEIKSEIGLLP